MPLMNYGVWKAKPTEVEVERDDNDPHAQVTFEDGVSKMKLRAAINVKSGDNKDSRLVYWLLRDFKHPIREKLRPLSMGWHDMCRDAPHERTSLDLLRDGLVDVRRGEVAPHNLPGPSNDVSDAVELFFRSIKEEGPTLYAFGEKFWNWDKDEEGLHDIHMNQGSSNIVVNGNVKKIFKKYNAINQDGGVILEFPDGRWEAFFTAFASQTAETDPVKGNPIGTTLGELLKPTPRPSTPAVAIIAALINPRGPDGGSTSEEVRLRNKSGADVSLAGWRIENRSGNAFRLPDDATLRANGAGATLKIPGVALTNKGGTIVLKNASGAVVDSVTYSEEQGEKEGEMVEFERDR